MVLPEGAATSWQQAAFSGSRVLLSLGQTISILCVLFPSLQPASLSSTTTRSIAGPTNDEGWRESGRWPTLKTYRYSQPGCAKIGNKVIIAGGAKNGKQLKSTEVLDIIARTTSDGGKMASARIRFNLAKISSGGQGCRKSGVSS